MGCCRLLLCEVHAWRYSCGRWAFCRGRRRREYFSKTPHDGRKKNTMRVLLARWPASWLARKPRADMRSIDCSCQHADSPAVFQKARLRCVLIQQGIPPNLSSPQQPVLIPHKHRHNDTFGVAYLQALDRLRVRFVRIIGLADVRLVELSRIPTNSRCPRI